MLLRQINQEVLDYQSKNIQIVQGMYFNQKQTIEKIYFYYNSKFMTGEIDEEGDRKYFYNIVKNPCKVFSKAIDFDTKNIRLLTAGGGDPLKTWFMERDLKYWMRDKQFGLVLNRLFKELPIYGTVVLKVVDGTPHFVDLRNFIVDQGADTISSMNYKTEIHNLTASQFRKVASKMGWEQSKVDKVIDEFHKMKGTSHIRLYERYGEVAQMKDGIPTSYPYQRSFLADVGVDEYDQFGNLMAQHEGVLLDAQDWDGDPYWEFHAEKMPGRWLGIGVVETLFEPQIKENEIANVQTKTTYWAGLRVFQTRDSAINRNMMTDVRNGEILNSDSEITQVDMSDRNLAFFNEETQKWLKNRDELTFSYDVVQGERLPAGTPLGSAKIAVSQTLSYFEQIQETIALDVKEMLYEVVLPTFQKENTSEHTLRLVGQDLDAFIGMVKNDMVMKEIIRQVTSGKPFPTNQEKDVIGLAIEESIRQHKEKILTIPKGFYKDLKYDVDIDITGESVDTRVRYATRFAILQAITADPTMTTDPTKRKILAGMAEDGGLNPADFLETPKNDIGNLTNMSPENRRAGGGVSAPAMGASIPGQETATV